MHVHVAALLLLVSGACALEARWTPAANGGPARFSKKHRDAAGIDDSRWIGEDDGTALSGFSLLPESPAGWVLSILVAAMIFVLARQQQQPQAHFARSAHTGGSRPPSEASEAARQAFLQRFAQPGEAAAPSSRKCD